MKQQVLYAGVSHDTCHTSCLIKHLERSKRCNVCVCVCVCVCANLTLYFRLVVTTKARLAMSEIGCDSLGCGSRIRYQVPLNVVS
jgi:hypothetical protein